MHARVRDADPGPGLARGGTSLRRGGGRIAGVLDRDDPHDPLPSSVHARRGDGTGRRGGRRVKLFRRAAPPAEPAPAPPQAPAPAFDLERFTREIETAAAVIAPPEATPRWAHLPKLKGQWEAANRQ